MFSSLSYFNPSLATCSASGSEAFFVFIIKTILKPSQTEGTFLEFSHNSVTKETNALKWLFLDGRESATLGSLALT